MNHKPFQPSDPISQSQSHQFEVNSQSQLLQCQWFFDGDQRYRVDVSVKKSELFIVSRWRHYGYYDTKDRSKASASTLTRMPLSLRPEILPFQLGSRVTSRLISDLSDLINQTYCFLQATKTNICLYLFLCWYIKLLPWDWALHPWLLRNSAICF